MSASTLPYESLRIIRFSRRGPNAFDGEFFVCGNRFEDFKLDSSVGRIPQDACDAVKRAKEILERGGPHAYEQSVEALNAVSTMIVADWPF